MAETVRAAAERLRKHPYVLPGIWEDCNCHQPHRDIKTLAEAYLAEHPADDAELHTEEWLRSVGFDTDWFPDHGRPLCIKFGLCGKLSIWSNGVTMISIRGCYERIGEHHTRGDVRKLLRCFQLKETGE